MLNNSHNPIWITSSSPVVKNGTFNNPISIDSSSPVPLVKTERTWVKTEPKPSNLREAHPIPSSPPPRAVLQEIRDPSEEMDDAVSMSSQLSSSAIARTYRKAKPLPYRLRQNANVYLEDRSF